MATEFTFASASDRFPVGTIVNAYPSSARPVSNPDSPPSGAAVSTSSVSGDGSLTFTGLAEGRFYVAYASVNGTSTYRGFRTDAAPGTVDSPGTVGPPGPPGAQGPPGQPGQDTTALSDAVRGADGRYYRIVAGALKLGAALDEWELVNDANSRPQNAETVTTDSRKITVGYPSIGAQHIGDFQPNVGENLAAVGIRTLKRPGLTSSDILLRQDRRLADTLTNTGTAWTKELGDASPWTPTGLTNVEDDFAAYIASLANIASHWRFSEASGATLTDAVGGHTGAVVGSGTTYAVTGLLPSDAADKGMTTTGVSTNELTVPTTGITQAAFSVIWHGRVEIGQTTLFRDHTSITGTGYYVASDGVAAPGPFISYRMGDAGSTYSSVTPWASLADGQAHTIVATKNGATVCLYLDGVLIHTAGTAGSTAISTPFHFGRNGNTATYAPATVSEFATVARAVTASEALNAAQAATADGLLHITHVDMGSTLKSGITLTQQGALRPVLVGSSVTATGFAIKFLDDTSTQIMVADTDMAVGIAREVTDRIVDPTNVVVDAQVVPEDDWVSEVDVTAPIAHLRLGEASGTTVTDRIGALDGAKTAGVTLGASGGIVGDADTAVTFDGIQGKISFGNPGLTSAWSLGVLFRCTGAGSVGSTGLDTIIGWAGGGGTNTKRITVSPTTGAVTVDAGGATLVTASGATVLNAWQFLLLTWDGVTESLILNGLLVASANTANVTLNAAFYLGSYLPTSTNYSFKGDQDELLIWNRKVTLNEAQQLYVTARDTVLNVDRSDQAQITFQGTFETLAPSPVDDEDQPLPTTTALPAGDQGASVTGNISLATYRGSLEAKAPYAGWSARSLPASQPARDAIELNGMAGAPAATSDAWKTSFCGLIGINPTTGATVTAQQGGSTPVYLRVAGEWIYVVGADQPLRTITDFDSTVSGWATTFNNTVTSLGGLPVPADALPHFTSDKYCFIYQPSTNMWITLYGFSPQLSERARTTLQLTGSPSSGGFFLQFIFMDHVNSVPQTFYTQTPVLYNDSAAQIATKLMAAKTTAGAALGTTRAGVVPVTATGGPLNVAPVVLEFPLAAPMRGVGMLVNDNFMNAGTCHFTYKNADPWTAGRLCSISKPTLTDGHEPHIASGGGHPATAAATHIDWMPLVIDWDEYKTALANGTGLGHVIAMSIGNAAAAPFGFVYPATSGDGTLGALSGAMVPQGALGTFPVGADFSRVAPEFMPIARTIQDKGFIPIDKTGGGAEFIFRTWGAPDTTIPFPGPAAFQFGGSNYMAYMRSLPWHQLQFIDPVEVQAGW